MGPGTGAGPRPPPRPCPAGACPPAGACACWAAIVPAVTRAPVNTMLASTNSRLICLLRNLMLPITPRSGYFFTPLRSPFGTSGAQALPRPLNLVGHGIFPAAPAGPHPVRHPLENRFDLVELIPFDLEQLGNHPRPELRGPGGHVAARRRLERARRPGIVIEKRERDNEAALVVDGDIAAIADATDEMQQPGFELLAARPHRRVACRRLRIRPCRAWLARGVRRLIAVFDAVAVVGERILALAVVQLHAAEIHVGGANQIRPRHALVDRREAFERVTRLPHRLERLGAVLAARHDRFDLGDPRLLHFQPHRQNDRHVVLTHRRKRDDLAVDLIGHMKLVGAAGRDRVPEPVRESQALAVLGIPGTAGERQALRVLRRERVQVLFRDTDEAIAFATAVFGLCRRHSSTRKDQDCNEQLSAHHPSLDVPAEARARRRTASHVHYQATWAAWIAESMTSMSSNACSAASATAIPPRVEPASSTWTCRGSAGSATRPSS